MNSLNRTRIVFIAVVGVALLIVVAGSLVRYVAGLTGDSGTAMPSSVHETPSNPTTKPVDERESLGGQGGTIEIAYWTNDTKAEWVHTATKSFNERRRARTASGKEVYVHVEQLSSGDVFPKIRAGEIQPTVWSPGDMGWVNEANVVWKDLTGRPLAPKCSPTVYTVIGIGMWRPMAEAMGWPDASIGWDEIVELAADPEGWARYGHPEWGQFKFGHTHPDSSNTGFLAMSTLAYSALDVTEGLTPELVKSERVVEAFRKLEENTYHYGMSTRSLFTLMAQRGPSYLHAGTNSETGLLATNKYQKDILRFPLVFIFPSDGTFWSGNPFCVLDTEWVTDEQREAAQLYHEYLVSPEAQEVAIDIGLRPAIDIELHVPISLENGTDPRASPETVPALQAVSGEVATAIKDVFYLTKKKATVVIALDTSASMRGDKIVNAVEGTANFVKRLARDDEVFVYSFSDTVIELQPSGRVGNVVESLGQTLNGLWAEGNTALYDAVCQAVESVGRMQEADKDAGEKRLYGIVVLSDGDDTNSEKTESDMFNCLPSGEDVEGVKVFTIAYGDDANKDLLLRIANRTNGKAFTGDPDTIEQVYLAISFEQ
jgi:Ca-activated chloride channel family protein